VLLTLSKGFKKMSFTNLFRTVYISSVLLHVLTFSNPVLAEKKGCEIKQSEPKCRVDVTVQVDPDLQKREKPKDNGNPKKRDLISRWCKLNENPKTHNCQDGSGSGAFV
jgi:hypothetical protein